MNGLMNLLPQWIFQALPIPVPVEDLVPDSMLGQEFLLLMLIILASFLVVLNLLALFFYFLGDKILLRWYHAREVRDVTSSVYEIVHRFATKADIPAPKVFIADSAMPNAFTLSRSAMHASIIVTNALVELLDKEEMEAVLAHELVHVKRGDSLPGTIVAVLSGILTALVTFAFWGSIFTGFGQEDDPAPNIIKFFVTSLVAPVAATIIQLKFAPYRESLADEQSLYLHDKADKLVSALQKIDERLKSDIFDVNPSHVHLFIMNPLHNGEVTIMDFSLPTYHFLFRTHPATDERVARLRMKKMIRNDKGRTSSEEMRFGLIKPLFFSFMSYLFVLFVIIVIDTFNKKDFDFTRAAAISAVYLGAILILFTIMFTVFRVKLKTSRFHELNTRE